MHVAKYLLVFNRQCKYLLECIKTCLRCEYYDDVRCKKVDMTFVHRINDNHLKDTLNIFI